MIDTAKMRKRVEDAQAKGIRALDNDSVIVLCDEIDELRQALADVSRQTSDA